MSVSTHVLDTARGVPAEGMPITLWREVDGALETISSGVTDFDGRVRDFAKGASMVAGTYRIRFDTAAYHASVGVEGFYPDVVIRFVIRRDEEHYHVPLLISPYGYSTYRGS